MFIGMLWVAVTLQGENGEEERGRKKGEEGRDKNSCQQLGFPAIVSPFLLFSPSFLD